MILGYESEIKTLSRLNFTYRYIIIMYESNFVEALKELEKVYKNKAFNLTLEIESLIISRNQQMQLDFGYEPIQAMADEEGYDEIINQRKRTEIMNIEAISEQI